LLDRSLILGGLPVGLVLGAFVWLMIGHGGPQVDALEASVVELQKMTPASSRRVASAAAGLALQGVPLFGRANSEALGPEPALVLQGLVRTPRRMAALIAINGKPADWLSVGETRDGVTLQDITAHGVTVTSANGAKDISFGAAAPAPTMPTAPPANDSGPPPGFRSPPAPASAPPTS